MITRFVASSSLGETKCLQAIRLSERSQNCYKY
jgi:hypothetical protein